MMAPRRVLPFTFFVLAFLCMSADLEGVAQAASIPRVVSGMAAVSAEEADAKPSSKLAVQVLVQSLARLKASTDDGCYPATCGTPCQSLGVSQCTETDYTSASSLATAKCRPGSSKSYDMSVSPTDLGGTGDGLVCLQGHETLRDQCLECRTYCTSSGGTKHAVVNDNVNRTANCDNTAYSAAWMAFANLAVSNSGNYPLNCSDVQDLYQAVSLSGCCAEAVYATMFTPNINIFVSAGMINLSSCQTPKNITTDCPLWTDAGYAANLPTVMGECPSSPAGLTDQLDLGLQRTPNCPSNGLQEFFRTTSTSPNQLTEAEHSACSTGFLCESYCKECPVGTFDYGHATGWDSNCISDAGTNCSVCGFMTGSNGNMSMTSCGSLTSSNDACAMIGRHDCPPGTEAPRRDVVGAYSNACSECQIGTYGPGGLTAQGQTLFTALQANSATPTAEVMAAVLDQAQPCIVCPAGHFSGAIGATQCLSCVIFGPASYTDGQGSSQCKTCGSGSYLESNSCRVCPIGHSCSGDGAKSACSVSVLDASGSQTTYYQDLEGQSTCKACGAGSAVGQPNQDGARVSCSLCPLISTYSEDGSTCQTCGDGSYTGGFTSGSATTCTACEPGSSCMGGSKTTCVGGSYAEGTGLTVCQTCATGSYTAASAGATSCAACPVAKYLAANNSAAAHDRYEDCLACPSGKYNDLDGQGACKDCNLCTGTNQEVGTSCSDRTDAMCTCKAGSGRTSSDGSSLTCALCADNTYSELPGADACQTCSTDLVGATGPYTCSGAAFDNTQTTCGGVAENSSAICPGGSGWDTTTDTSTVRFLTWQDWPPYKCGTHVTYEATFGGNTQCVSDHCEGAVYGNTIPFSRMDRIDSECVLPATVCGSNYNLTDCTSANSSTSYSCKYQCKAGFNSSTFGPLVCRGGSMSNGGSQPLFMKQTGDMISCEQVKCPDNSEGYVDSGCTIKAGYYGSVTAKTESPFFDSTITECEKGTYSTEAMSSCESCATGQYNNLTAQASCKACTICSAPNPTVTTVCKGTADAVCGPAPSPAPSPSPSPSPSPPQPPAKTTTDPPDILAIVLGSIGGFIALIILAVIIYKAMNPTNGQAEAPADQDQIADEQPRQQQEEELDEPKSPVQDLESESESDPDPDPELQDKDADEEPNEEKDEAESDSEN